MYEDPERESPRKVYLQQVHLEARWMKLEDQVERKKNLTEDKIPQLDVVWSETLMQKFIHNLSRNIKKITILYCYNIFIVSSPVESPLTKWDKIFLACIRQQAGPEFITGIWKLTHNLGTSNP